MKEFKEVGEVKDAKEINKEKLVKIGVLEDEVEEHLLQMILTQEGIPHLIKRFDTTYLSAIFELSKGSAELFAPLDAEEKTRALWAELKASSPLEEDFLPDDEVTETNNEE